MGKRGSVLPNGYTEVEYLETEGNAYINLGNSFPVTVNPASTTLWKAIIGFSDVNVSNNRRFIAAYSNASRLHYCELTVNNVFGCFLGTNSASQTTPVLSANKMYNITMTITPTQISSTVIVNGETVSQSETNAQGSDTSAFYLFRLGAVYKGVGQRVGRNKLYYNNELKCDLIPCRDSNNVGYMYDRISGQLFSNAGNGDFILGNDI